MSDIKKYLIKSTETVKGAIRSINDLSGDPSLTLFVVNDNDQVIGSVTDGDIRRGLLEDISIYENIQAIMCKNFQHLKKDDFSVKKIISLKAKKIKLVPYLDEDDKIIKLIDLSLIKSLLPLDVVIMAGGFGKRLLPFTENTPKPLLKLDNKPIIEHNIDNFIDYGITDFHITISYLANQITEYLKDGSDKKISINYVREEVPLGTIGSLSLIENFKHDHILIYNADLLTNLDFEAFYQDFVAKDADLSVASTYYNVDVPYAVISTNNNNNVLQLVEKPTYSYHSNAGIYLIKKHLIDLLPKGEYFDAVSFIQSVIEKSYNVITFPILDYWLDIGKPENLIKASEDIKQIKF